MTFAATSADGTIIGLSTNDLIDTNSVDFQATGINVNLQLAQRTYQIINNNGGGPINVALPPANQQAAGKTFWICENGGTQNIVVTEQGGGNLSQAFQSQARLFMCDGATWYISSIS